MYPNKGEIRLSHSLDSLRKTSFNYIPIKIKYIKNLKSKEHSKEISIATSSFISVGTPDSF